MRCSKILSSFALFLLHNANSTNGIQIFTTSTECSEKRNAVEHAHHNYGQHQHRIITTAAASKSFSAAHALLRPPPLPVSSRTYIAIARQHARLGRQHNIAANDAAAAGRHRCGHSSASQHSYAAAEQLPAHEAVTMQMTALTMTNVDLMQVVMVAMTRGTTAAINNTQS